MTENRSQIMLALQHDPRSEYSSLHDHPVSMHLEAIEKNAEEISAAFKKYHSIHEFA